MPSTGSSSPGSRWKGPVRPAAHPRPAVPRPVGPRARARPPQPVPASLGRQRAVPPVGGDPAVQVPGVPYKLSRSVHVTDVTPAGAAEPVPITSAQDPTLMVYQT